MGYRVHRLQPQQLVTECTGWYWLHSRVHLPQQLVTECTGWYWLHSLVHLLQQLITQCTGWYWLHSLVHWLQQMVTECTNWYWLHSLVHLLQPAGYKKKKKKAKYRPVAVKLIGHPSLPVFCRLQRFAGYS